MLHETVPRAAADEHIVQVDDRAVWKALKMYSINHEKADGPVFNPIRVIVHTKFPLPGTVNAVYAWLSSASSSSQ